MKQQWLKESELKKIQSKMLRSIIRHSYENVPFYHNKMKNAKITPYDIKCAEDLQKMPLTTKQELKETPLSERISINTNLKKCWTPHTGGSTGIPLTVAYSESDEDYQKAVALRPNLSCGQKIFDRWIIISSPNRVNSEKKWFQKIGVFSPQFISLFDNLDNQLLYLKKFNPDIIDGFASSIYLLSLKIRETDSTKIKPRIIYTTSEVLTKQMRETIESVFNLKVYDQFGCVELGRTAWECTEHMGYHIDSDAVVMEFLKNGLNVAPGEQGEITYTGLYNFTMPLIRYTIEDVGILSEEKCPCGRGLPLLKLIEGRKDEFLFTPDGKIHSPIIWQLLLKPISEIYQFRIIQEKMNRIVIQIVKSDNYSQETTNSIINQVTSYFGDNINFEIEFLQEIPREKSGKVRAVLSRINNS